jgi:hypothetical protein
MNNTLHTPAPWKHDPTWGIIKYGKNEICALHSGNIANAHLISAAPDLLSALEEMMSVFQDHEQYDEESAEVIQSAREALRKAKGEA